MNNIVFDAVGQLTNAGFLKSMFELIETNHDDEDLVSASIKFLLSFNLRFEYPYKNPLIKTLLSISAEISSRELIERLIFLFNRSSKYYTVLVKVSPNVFCHFSWSDRTQNDQFNNKTFSRLIWWWKYRQWYFIIGF